MARWETHLQLLRDARDPSHASIARRAREKRFRLFLELMSGVERPASILDVGGTPAFWETMDFVSEEQVSLTIANLEQHASARPNVRVLNADARDLSMFRDDEFDVVFSNSVIEHVPGRSGKEAMAREIRRVGRRWFVQTPNRYFPIEPHFVFPLFQFLPVRLRAWLLRKLPLAHVGRIADPTSATEIAESVELLGRRDFESMFPGSRLYRERFLGLTKSFICYGGW